MSNRNKYISIYEERRYIYGKFYLYICGINWDGKPILYSKDIEEG